MFNCNLQKLLTINNLDIVTNENPSQLIEVNQGEEQQNFINLFAQWNPNLWQVLTQQIF